ncbi:MAG: hypothetical protein HYW91_02130 [Candidatus Sungbacteria bacterium]|nr:hypothetical protein [Candidatus Sungbacteria bacterium]
MAKQAWRLIFVEGLIQNFLTGEECLDFRIYREGSNDFKKGQLIEGHFMDGISLLLEVTEDTVVKRFKDITDEERAKWAHFNDPEMSHTDMMEIMRGYYPGLTDESEAAINALRIPRINGRPIAGFLPEDLQEQIRQKTEPQST